MNEMKLGMVEAKFADIIWENQPLSTKELVKICEEELNWKRTTTYTVLKKLCDRKIFKTEIPVWMVGVNISFLGIKLKTLSIEKGKISLKPTNAHKKQ